MFYNFILWIITGNQKNYLLFVLLKKNLNKKQFYNINENKKTHTHLLDI